ncbi:unnamed protein product [marine sediment metagenome]|uniref:Uncharacterized protein n=1 Tax=marine sediment metagenome TaxID=412755 RepID=X0ZRY2_9ZZZZ
MEEYIITILEEGYLRFNYIKIENNNSLKKIYNLFKNNISEKPSISIECYYYGVYYRYIKNNYDLMKKYYLMGIELNDSNSMVNLAFYYQFTEKNYDLMKKYYLMAIELNNSAAMNNLAFYQFIEKNDQSFVELYKYEDKNKIIKLFNYKFENNINLDQKYYYSFLQWKSDKISDIISN